MISGPCTDRRGSRRMRTVVGNYDEAHKRFFVIYLRYLRRSKKHAENGGGARFSRRPGPPSKKQRPGPPVTKLFLIKLSLSLSHTYLMLCTSSSNGAMRQQEHYAAAAAFDAATLAQDASGTRYVCYLNLSVTPLARARVFDTLSVCVCV